MRVVAGVRQVGIVAAVLGTAALAVQAQPQPAVLARPRHGTDTPANLGIEVGEGQFSISADGRYLAFASRSSDLTPTTVAPGGTEGDTNGVDDVFVRDLVNGTTTLVSRRAGSSAATGDGSSYSPMISADGSVVVFTSSASDLVAGDSNAVADVFAWDRATNTTSRVSLSSTGVAGDAASGLGQLPQVSADGRYVLFASRAGTLAPNVGATGHVQLSCAIGRPARRRW